MVTNFQFYNVDDFIAEEGCYYLSSDPTKWKLKPIGGFFDHRRQGGSFKKDSIKFVLIKTEKNEKSKH